MTEKIAEYLSECPVLEGVGINVDYLDGKVGSCSVEAVSSNPVYKKYTDGGVLFEKRFVVALRLEHSKSLNGNSDASEKCEQIEKWICNQEKSGRLPVLGPEYTPLAMEVSKSFCVVSSASVDARYEAELKIIYYTE